MEQKIDKPSKKDFHRSGKKSFRGNKTWDHGKKSFGRGKPPMKRRRKLEPGVEFVDRELGVGIVRTLTDDGIVVAFGDVEKVIPRRKPEGKKEGFHSKGHFQKQNAKKTFQGAKPMEKKVFTFDVKPEDKKEHSKGTAPKKREVTVGLVVVDDTLGKGVVSRITERGTYVTYESTGENVMYPRGLTVKLLQSAFPQEKKEKKEDLPKGQSRTYTVPEAPKRVAKPKVAPKPVKETHRGNTHYIELGVGTPVHSPKYGQGVITEIAQGKLTVDFGHMEKEFHYPKAFMEGEIQVVEE